jgi:dimethylamine corrinoid protein
VKQILDQYQKEILDTLARTVVTMDEAGARKAAEAAIAKGIAPYLAIQAGLSRGMAEAGRKYENGAYFIPQLLVCSDAMYAAMEILRGALLDNARDEAATSAGTVVIGVVAGDTHDIGKNMVKIMLAAAGYRLIDLGRDVSVSRFLDAVAEERADLLCLSTLMSATMEEMIEVIARLEANGLRQQTRVLIGGCAVSEAFARRIGADGYAPNAAAAVRSANALVKCGGKASVSAASGPTVAQ